MKSVRGFTLIEVLVALAIIAVALGAAMRASATASDNSFAIQERTLARWVAENELSRIRLAKALPSPGVSEGESVQGAETFIWRAEIEGTPNPNFRKIRVQVRRSQSPGFIADVEGYTLPYQ